MPYKDPKVRLIKQREYVQAHRELYRSSDAKYRSLHPDKVKEHQRNWRAKNIEHLKQYRNEHRKNNLELYRQYDKVKQAKHKVEINRRQREIYKYRKENDPQYYIALRCRNRVRSAVKSQKARKVAATLALLGCTVEFLKQYLESQFYPHPDTGEQMTWSNYGKFGWHIDHEIPCDKFDLINPEEQRKCFHYTNLQPMWWQENLIKGASIRTKRKENYA